MFLSKENALFGRNDKGELLPVEVPLQILEKSRFEGGQKVVVSPAPVVSVRPVPRGRWLELMRMSEVDQDKTIIKEFLVEPRLDDADYAALKPLVMSAIVTAVTALSLGVESGPVTAEQRKSLTEAEEWMLKKKLSEQSKEASSSSTSTDTTCSTSVA